MTAALAKDPSAEAWARVCGALRAELGDTTFKSWVQPLSLLEVAGDRVRLVAPTKFVRDWVLDHYGVRMRALWRDAAPGVRELEIIGAAAAPSARPTPATTVRTADERKQVSVLRARWRRAVRGDLSLTANARLAAMAIEDHWNVEQQVAWPSYELLAEELGISRRRAIDSVAQLEARGWIVIERTGGRASNRYRLAFGTPAPNTRRAHVTAAAEPAIARAPELALNPPVQLHAAAKSDASVTSLVTAASPQLVTAVSPEPLKKNFLREPEAVVTPTSPHPRAQARAAPQKQEAIQGDASRGCDWWWWVVWV